MKLHGIFVLVFLLAASISVYSHEFALDGRVLELDESNFESAISAFDYVLVDFYAPWCGHCKRLSPELDKAAQILGGLDKPIVIAKVDADKYRSFTSKYEIDGFPTLKVFMHGVPVDYSGPRKAESITRYLKKFVSPDVLLLESDSDISNFIDTAGLDFPIFIGFGLEKAIIEGLARKYKKKMWFSVVKDFSEDAMITYDFDKVPAVVSLHPKFNERSVFYGPFEEDFLDEFIKQNLLPLTVPINFDTLKMLMDDERKIVLTIMEDESDYKSLQLIKILRAAASANRDLIFAYVGLKQFDSFLDPFEIDTSKLPKMLVWGKNEEYSLVVDSESLGEEDQGSQVSQFLEGYREGRVIKKTFKGPSFIGYINSLININTVYAIIFVVAVIMVVRHIIGVEEEEIPPRKQAQEGVKDEHDSTTETESIRDYQPGDKED